MSLAIPAPMSPANKLEAALVLFLESLVPSNPALANVSFYVSQSSAKKTLPACVVYCEVAHETAKGTGVYWGHWYVYPWTQKDDDNAPGLDGAPPAVPVAPEITQDQRLYVIQQALRNDQPTMSFVNYPAMPRPVPKFHIFGFAEWEDKHDDRARAFGEALYYQGGFAIYDVRG